MEIFMKLEKLILKNFRGYHGEHSIDINSLTALVGRNDVGKTTILDALGVFFEHK
ncbi:TPA: AAA family ATPase, partial [Enterobacter asburiae]